MGDGAGGAPLYASMDNDANTGAGTGSQWGGYDAVQIEGATDGGVDM